MPKFVTGLFTKPKLPDIPAPVAPPPPIVEKDAAAAGTAVLQAARRRKGAAATQTADNQTAQLGSATLL